MTTPARVGVFLYERNSLVKLFRCRGLSTLNFHRICQNAVPIYTPTNSL